MTAKGLSSRQEAEEVLYSACKQCLRNLQELNTIHMAIDYPGRVVASTEPEYIFRLRKVLFHVQAIISWPVDTDILHVMGPDIRAARKQLGPMVNDQSYSGNAKVSSPRRHKNFDRGMDKLARFSHPTPAILIHARDIGGLGRANSIVCLYELYIWLCLMVTEYGLGLSFVADLLDRSKQQEIFAVINRAKPEGVLANPEEIFHFVDATDV